MLESIKLNNWRQFDTVLIKFHRRLTIITGANGAGKTTMLNIINNQLGWGSELVSLPQKDKSTGALKFATGIWKDFPKLLNKLESDSINIHYNPDRENSLKIGEIKISNNEIIGQIKVPKDIGSTYRVWIENIGGLIGIPIPSHRPIYKYQNVPHIPTTLINKESAYRNYFQSRFQKYNGGHSSHFENYFIKETLISLATFGYGNNVVEKNEDAISVYEGFQDVLRKILPPKLGFRKIIIRIPEVILDTQTGEFSLDAVSGGIASIIDLAWQIYMFDNKGQDFIVTLDEPENHLHPEMQRTILPNFINAFPQAQFIVASHNPFIISSHKESSIYVLDYNEDNRVNSLLLDQVEKSGSANEILRSVLGIDSTLPNWVNDELKEIIKRYSDKEISKDNIKIFKSELEKVGLGKYIPESIVNLLEKTKE